MIDEYLAPDRIKDFLPKVRIAFRVYEMQKIAEDLDPSYIVISALDRNNKLFTFRIPNNIICPKFVIGRFYLAYLTIESYHIMLDKTETIYELFHDKPPYILGH